MPLSSRNRVLGSVGTKTWPKEQFWNFTSKIAEGWTRRMELTLSKWHGYLDEGLVRITSTVTQTFSWWLKDVNLLS